MPLQRQETGSSRIYLDHAATSPLRPEVWEAMQAVVGDADFNPASVHAFGRRAQQRLEEAREELAAALGASRRCLILTGGGTHSDNLAILGFLRAHRNEGPRIFVSAIEHKAVLEPAKRAAREGAEVHIVPVAGCGTIIADELERELASDSGRPTLVSVMWANNEVGTVQPVERVCEAAHRYGALFHTDAVQAFGKLPVSLERVPADMLTITAHKIGGPVGIGLLYVRDGLSLEPLMYGGSQERAMWPGTQNPMATVGFATAAQLAVADLPVSAPAWRRLRDHLAERLLASVPGLRVHAAEAQSRMPNLLSVGIPGCDQASLLLSLDLAGIAISGGSACSSGSVVGSHVLEAMGAGSAETEYAALRFSFGHSTTAQEIDRAADAVVRAVARFRPTRDTSTAASGGPA
ncbi:MAG: cysteine desulfurase family protein [Gemmatimonadota bacterium]